MQVYQCRTLRVGWGTGARAAALAVLVVTGLVLVSQGSVTILEILGFGCMFIGYACFALVGGRSVRGHVLEVAGDSVRLRPSDDPGRRFPVRRLISPDSVRDGYALTASRLVLILRAGTTIDADLDSESAQRVLDHLRVSPTQRVLRMPVSAPVGWLETGRDGVRIAAGLLRRFIPYRSIQKVSRARRHLVFETAAGSVRTPRIDDSRAIPVLVSRIEERRAAAALAGAPPLDALDRRERPIGEWRAALDELARGGKAFRGAALRDDDLQRVLDEPGAPLEQRIGAALALRSRGGNAQGRIRVAAGSSVERRVRVALEAAAADDVDERAIERALDKPEPLRVVAVEKPHENED